MRGRGSPSRNGRGGSPSGKGGRAGGSEQEQGAQRGGRQAACGSGAQTARVSVCATLGRRGSDPERWSPLPARAPTPGGPAHAPQRPLSAAGTSSRFPAGAASRGLAPPGCLAGGARAASLGPRTPGRAAPSQADGVRAGPAMLGASLGGRLGCTPPRGGGRGAAGKAGPGGAVFSSGSRCGFLGEGFIPGGAGGAGARGGRL